jgi:hypothetical protein
VEGVYHNLMTLTYYDWPEFEERELSDVEVEAELAYRKFVIYPFKEKIILKRRVDKEIKSASVFFNFEEFTFVAEIGNTTMVIKSFNEFLIRGKRNLFLNSS